MSCLNAFSDVFGLIITILSNLSFDEGIPGHVQGGSSYAAAKKAWIRRREHVKLRPVH